MFIIAMTSQLLLINAFGQHSLIVRQGQSKTIDAGIQSLLVDTLLMENNSKLIIADAVPGFSLIAKYAVVGDNVLIDATRHTAVVNAANGANGLDAPTFCTIPGEGSSGHDGSEGTDAADLFFYLRIRSIGSLTIDAKGTNGGAGGKGGKGGKGPDSNPNAFSTCSAKGGGKGGNGGNGGTGGKGGLVEFSYTFIDADGNFLEVQPTVGQVTASVNGGMGGAGGTAGPKGEPGRKVNGTTDSSLNQNVPSSSNGTAGKPGRQGSFIRTAIKQNLVTASR